MKKNVLIMVLVLMFSLSLTAKGGVVEETEVVGGITYNTFDYKITNDNFTPNEYFIDDSGEFEDGRGFYGGLAYWLSDSFHVELGFDYAETEDKEIEAKTAIDIYGPYAKLKEFTPIEIIEASIGLGYYFCDYEDKDEEVEFSADGIGYSIGANLSQNLSRNLSFSTGVSYRKMYLELDESAGIFESLDLEMDLSGIRAHGGISYKF